MGVGFFRRKLNSFFCCGKIASGKSVSDEYVRKAVCGCRPDCEQAAADAYRD